MEQILRYACIGAGGIARKKHLNGYSRLSSVKPVAVCDTNLEAAKRLASDFGISGVYTDYKELLKRERPDLVSVCTPNALHKEITVEALKHGCNVHVEKPIALNENEAKEIAAAEKRYGKQVQVGLNKRYLGNTILVKRLLDAGFFGHIYHTRCGWERNSGIPGVGRWFTNKALSGGGALIDLGVHYLDLALSVMGWPEPEKVSGSISNTFLLEGNRIRRGYLSSSGTIDVEDMANGSVIMKSGQTLLFCFSWASNIEEEIQYIEALGTKAGFKIQNGKLTLYTQLGGSMFTMIPDETTLPLDQNEFQSFVDCIRTGQKPEATVEQGIRVMKLIDMIYDSFVQWKDIN